MRTSKNLLALIVFIYAAVLSARLNLHGAPASVDTAFDPGANSTVNSLAVEPDGKILVCGLFTTLGGTNRSFIGRLNGDGTLDTTFNPGATAPVDSLVVQADGKILVGGIFTALGGTNRSRIGRLNSDGTLDSTFNPGANGTVNTLTVQADGKILVGGAFTTLGGTNRSFIGRLNGDGTLDKTFNPGATAAVNSMVLQADGKILVGGAFTTLGGTNRNRIGRLNSDGTLDSTFNPGANGTVNTLTVQADGKILVGGMFSTLAGTNRNNIGRLNGDGTLDRTFNPGASSMINSLAVQADGKILAGGAFTSLGGTNRSFIGRLNGDGTLDTNFNPGASGVVNSLAVQADGKILAGGVFTSLGGTNRSRIGRLNATDAAISGLTSDGATITWLRGGTSPEVGRTTFEWSTDGLSWTILGAGNRIASGWQLSGLSLPSGGTIRARGYASVGYYNGSTSILEAFAGQVIIAGAPVSRTNLAGTTASFSVYAGGDGPLTYQWRKNGGNLADAQNVSGSSTAVLVLTNVLGADAGAYSVVVTGASGSVTSAVAYLTVLEPAITSQPAGLDKNLGESATLSVTAVGTPPLSYQWRHGGVALPGATGSSLVLTNLQANDEGNYDVVVTSIYGSVTSRVAVLNVNLALVDDWNPGPQGNLYALDPQPDGKTLVGGVELMRLNANGTVDTNFAGANWGSSGYGVNTLAIQPDGKILAGGYFYDLAGRTAGPGLARLYPDGTVDTNFSGWISASDFVETMVVQPDGKILVGGGFYNLDGNSHTGLGRLNGDGTFDPTFTAVANDSVLNMAIQPDGRIVTAGYFTTLAGDNRNYIARLSGDGALDNTFNPGANAPVYCLALQPDGKILVAGAFTTLGGTNRNYLGRLNGDGTVDMTFNPNANGAVYSLVLQADGKIVISGNFTVVGGQSRARIAMLNSDGTLDTHFKPSANSSPVSCLALQADGAVLVAGTFASIAGQSRAGLARLQNVSPATQTIEFEGSTLTWLRGGSSPEAWRATIEYSPDGLNWTNRDASRIPGGWRMGGVALPPGATIRARAYTIGGLDSGSGWFAESDVITRPPLILSQPTSQTNNVGTDVTFSVAADGTPMLSFQWRKDGTNLIGETGSTLTLTNVQESDQGFYSAVVSNVFGLVTSSAALLVVNQRPIADAGATRQLYISANGADATVVLDGSRSSDPDDDLLQYTWYEAGEAAPVASNAVAVVTLSVGNHHLLLVVNDGALATTNSITVEVITTTEAVERLRALVNSEADHPKPLNVTLAAVIASIDRSNPVSAINQLLAFQNQVRAQVAPADPALAETFIHAAQAVIDVLSGGNTNPGGRPHGRFTSVARLSNGHAQMRFDAGQGSTYIIEASANLVNWEKIGVARPQSDGGFEFEDAQATRFPSRYYRIVSLESQ